MNRHLQISFILSLLISVQTAFAEEQFVPAAQDPTIESEIWDPIEPINRKVFWFNDKLDYILLEPMAKGYDFVVPNVAQKGVNNFFQNLGSPIYMVNDLLQGELSMFANHFARMMLNTTFGIGGFFDIADKYGIAPQDQNLSTTLAIWGIPNGPYLVMPIIGPMTLRSGIGQGIDRLMYPPNYFAYYIDVAQRTENTIVYGLQGTELLQTRADLLETIDEAKEISVDYYSFVQNTYYQIQRNLINRDRPKQIIQEDDFEYDDSLDGDF